MSFQAYHTIEPLMEKEVWCRCTLKLAETERKNKVNFIGYNLEDVRKKHNITQQEKKKELTENDGHLFDNGQFYNCAQRNSAHEIL